MNLPAPAVVLGCPSNGDLGRCLITPACGQAHIHRIEVLYRPGSEYTPRCPRHREPLVYIRAAQ